MTATGTAERTALRRRRATRAGAIGNFIEFYDFTLYGFFAVVISEQFFPSFSPQAGLLATFAVYGGAFVMRPVGALIFGHIADVWGRKRALLLAVVLMSLATTAIGLLPTYAAIGIAAPALLLLCRLAQAMSAGGEQSGAYVLVIEHSPVRERGRNGSWLVMAVMAGVATGALISVSMTAVLTDEQMATWGWRVPFLVALPLGALGLYLRLRLDESNAFQAASAAVERAEAPRSAPIVQALATVRREMLVLFAWVGMVSLAGYMLIGFMVTLMVRFEGYSMSSALLVMVLAFVLAMPLVMVVCRGSDRVSRRAFATVLTVGLALWTIPTFLLIETGPVGAVVGLTIYIVFLYPMNLSAGFAVVELFPVDIRGSASALPYQLAFALFGGTAAFIATWLAASYGPIAPAYYVTVVALAEIGVAWYLLPPAREMATVTTATGRVESLATDEDGAASTGSDPRTPPIPEGRPHDERGHNDVRDPLGPRGGARDRPRTSGPDVPGPPPAGS